MAYTAKIPLNIPNDIYISKMAINRDSFTSIPDKDGKTIYNLMIEVSNWDTQIPEDVNPRTHDADDFLKGKTPTIIYNSLKTEPNIFKFKNRGITILAKKVVFDDKTGTVSIYIEDCEKHGIADGGSTNAVLRKAQKNKETANAKIQVKIYTGIEDPIEIREICRSLNTSTSLKGYSLENAAGKYHDIKKIIDNGPYENKIGFEENSSHKFKIVDIITLLFIFNGFFRDGTKHPTESYASPNNVNDKYSNRIGEFAEGCEQLYPLINDFIELYVYVIELANSQSVAKIRKRYRDRIYDLSVSNYEKKKLYVATKETKNKKLPFSDKTIEFSPVKGLILPILSALRPLLEETMEETINKDGVKKTVWKTDPKKFIEKYKDDIFLMAFNELTLAQGNLTQYGKQKAVYETFFKYAEDKLKEEEIAQLKSELVLLRHQQEKI